MKYPLEHLIDRCIHQLKSGMDLEVILEQYPDDADELRPVLAAVAWMRVEIPAPGAARRVEGKQAVMAAAAHRRRELEATQGLINEIRAGVAIEDLVARASAQQRPLVLAAWRMHTTPAPQPSPERVLAGKKRLMVLVAQRRSLRERVLASHMSPASHLKAGVSGFVRGLLGPSRPRLARRAWSGAVSMAAVVLSLGLGAGRIGTAAADSLPGDPIYNIKRLGENARLFFAIDADQRAELRAAFVSDRLREMLALSEGGRDIPAGVLRDWALAQRNADATLRRLPVDQQERLVESLLSAFGGSESLGQALAGLPDDAGGSRMADLLKRMRDLEARALSAELGGTREPASAPSAERLPQAPEPALLPQPQAAAEESQEPAATRPPQAVAPAPAESDVPSLDAQLQPEPDFVQAPLVAEEEDEDEGERPAASADPSTDGPTAEPTDDSQIIQPPMQPPGPEEEPEVPLPGSVQEPAPGQP